MRVGLDVSWSAVSNGSSNVTATVEVWTGNQYNHSDSQGLSYSNSISGSTSYTNSQGSGTSTQRATKTYTYAYSTYGSSPGSATFTATLTGHYLGISPAKSGAYTIPARPYSAPNTPSAGISGAAITCSGNQNTATADKHWQYTDWQLEVNDVWQDWATDSAGSSTSKTYTASVNKRYRGRVRAKNSAGTSAYGTSGYWYTKPTAVSGSSASRPPGSTTVNLSWTNTAAYSGSVRIARSLDGSSWTVIQTLSGSATATTDTVPLNSEAFYIIYTDTPQGVNKVTSDGTAMMSVGLGYSAPGTPAVALTRNSDSAGVLNITGNQTNAAADKFWESIEYQVAVGSGAYGATTSVAGATTSIGLSGWVVNERYRVRARAVNVSGASEWAESNYAYTTPSVPTGAAVRQVDQAQVLLSATGVGTWTDLVRVERSTNEGWSWADIGAFAPAGSMLNLLGAGAAWYRFRTQTPDQLQSAWSATVQVAASFATDKSKIPGVTRIYAGTDRVRQVLVGATRFWTDGD